jgi:hypothetical protein
MARKGRWRQFVTRIAIMSVVMHAVMGALMLPGPAIAGTAGELVAQASAICGVPAANLAATGKQLPGRPCPICDGLATSGFLLEFAQTALIGRLTDPTVLRPSEELRPASISCHSHNNRGPPALA